MARRGSIRSDTVELLPVHRGKSPLVTTSASPSPSPSSRVPDLHKQGSNGTLLQQADRKIDRIRNWKISLFGGAVSSVVVLLFNLGFILWAVDHHNLEHGQGTLYMGRCEEARRMSTGFHLVINILATILLGASNYAMQCLCAPTRSDIDKAHQKRTWLDIGVPSVRNLTRISKKNAFLWISLSLSSLPLHLVYNSTVFLTLSANSYNVFAGNSSFTSLESVDNLRLRNDTYAFPNQAEQSFSQFHQTSSKGNLSRLSTSDCIDAYGKTFQSQYTNVMLITDDVNSTNFDFDVVFRQAVFDPQDFPSDPFPWICSKKGIQDYYDKDHACSYYLPGVRSKADTWTVKSYHVDHCLTEAVEEMCKLQYSLPLAIVVIVFNFIKAIIICSVALTSSLTNPPILTSGDAIASFIEKPDESTKGSCLVPREIRNEFAGMQYTLQMRYFKEPQRWKSAVSARRWSLCLISYIIAIAVVLILLSLGISNGQDAAEIWSSGLGAINSQTIVRGSNWPTSLTTNTVIANIPQAVFSVLYFASNAVFTTMSLAAEWSDYAVRRKGLRVSNTPSGAQRSTYFLSLPYRHALPLIVFAALLHWLISQSLFLVAVQAYDPDHQRAPEQDITSCGYSPVGIVSGLSVGCVMLSYLVGMAFRRFRSGMPVAGSCSWTMAAACHPGYGDGDGGEKEEVVYRPLKWGAVPLAEPDGVGHCTFSAEEVEMPENGRVYS